MILCEVWAGAPVALAFWRMGLLLGRKPILSQAAGTAPDQIGLRYRSVFGADEQAQHEQR